MQGLRGKLINLEGCGGALPAGVAWPRLLGTAQSSRATGPAVPLHPSLDRCSQGQGASPVPALSGHRRNTKFQKGQELLPEQASR